MKDYLKNKYVVAGIVVVSICLIAILSSFFYDDKVIAEDIKDDIKIKETIVEEKNKEEVLEFYVDVKGSVKKPGVYKVKDGMIVNDAIKLAGGLSSKANTNNINLSKKLSNEMVIYVYSKTEISKLTKKNEIPCTCEVVEVNNCINDDNEDEETTNVSGKINLNTASKEELMSLNGIGESKADAIIEYRNDKLFESIEDIKNIKGIGDAMFDKIKDDITV